LADWISWVSEPSAWVSLLTLTVLEIVLGIDNIVFISILAGKLPVQDQERARKTGLLLALGTRILLLLSIGYVTRLTAPIFTLPLPVAEEAKAISWRDVILLGGGLFLIWKSIKEIHAKFEGEEHGSGVGKATSFGSVIGQILVLDVIFSLDSVITAVGMADHIPVMIIAVIVAVVFMLWFSRTIADFVEKNPTVKMLALSFLVLIGANLVAEGLGQHIEKAYTYFAMAFAVAVELLNLRLRKKTVEPIHLRHSTVIDTE
jgi:predicted tellurium resistance membrane protein TerC